MRDGSISGIEFVRKGGSVYVEKIRNWFENKKWKEGEPRSISVFPLYRGDLIGKWLFGVLAWSVSFLVPAVFKRWKADRKITPQTETNKNALSTVVCEHTSRSDWICTFISKEYLPCLLVERGRLESVRAFKSICNKMWTQSGHRNEWFNGFRFLSEQLLKVMTSKQIRSNVIFKVKI